MDKSSLIELFYLPGYCPELNPIEYLNADLKARMSAAEPARNGVHLKRKVISYLYSIQKLPVRIRTASKAAPLQYAA